MSALPHGALALATVEARLPLAEIYDRLDFDSSPADRDRD